MMTTLISASIHKAVVSQPISKGRLKEVAEGFDWLW